MSKYKARQRVKFKPEDHAVPKKAKDRLERMLYESQIASGKLEDAAAMCREMMGLDETYTLKVPEWIFEKKENEPSRRKTEA